MTKQDNECVWTLKNDIFSCCVLQAKGFYNFRIIYHADDDKVRKYTSILNEHKTKSYIEYKKTLKEKLKKEENNNWIRNVIESCKIVRTDTEDVAKKAKISETENSTKEKETTNTKQEAQEETITDTCDEVRKASNVKACCRPKDVVDNKNEENEKHEHTEEQTDASSNEKNSKTEENAEKQEQTYAEENGSKTEEKNEKLENNSKSKAEDDKTVVADTRKTTKHEVKENILYNDTEFVIIPNHKWDQRSLSDFYLVLLFKNPDLYSIRELEDCKILERAKKAMIDTCKRVYNFEAQDVYLFFHYQPTFYSLHLHIVNVNFFGPFSTVTKAVLVDGVIANLKIDSDYYRKKDMHIICRK